MPMFITCPKCETTFSLPDDLYAPGKKARCSQCGNVFAMQAEPEASPDPEQGIGEVAPPVERSAPKTRRKLLPALVSLVAAILLVLLGYGGYLIYNAVTAPPDLTAEQATGNAESVPSPETDAYERLINSISLDEIRQFLVDNVAVGKLMVIQGLAVNVSDTSKDYITVEARILDGNNRVLARAQQICGVPLTLFQLQSLSEVELKEALDNRITILTNNTNIPPGGKVPFVIVFPSPPASMRTFEVRVIDAQDSPPQ